MRPAIVAVVVKVIAEVPGDVRESTETRDGVFDKPLLVCTIRRGMNTAVVHIEYQRENHVSIARETKGSVKLLCQYDT